MKDYAKISMRKLNTNDIFFLDFDDNNEPYDPYYVLRTQEPIGLLCLSIRTHQIITLNYPEEEIDEVYYFENMVNLFNIVRDENKIYRWLGFEYGKHKVLIDLEDLSCEKFDYENDCWIEVDSNDNFSHIENNDFLIINCEEKVHFKINLNTLNMYVSNTKHYFKYKPFYNFLLGEENDFVFDENNELNLIRDEVLL